MVYWPLFRELLTAATIILTLPIFSGAPSIAQIPRPKQLRPLEAGISTPDLAGNGADQAVVAGAGGSKLAVAGASSLTLLGGKWHIKRLPLPTSESMLNSPSWRPTMCLTIASPKPVPPVSEERLMSTR